MVLVTNVISLLIYESGTNRITKKYTKKSLLAMVLLTFLWPLTLLFLVFFLFNLIATESLEIIQEYDKDE